MNRAPPDEALPSGPALRHRLWLAGAIACVCAVFTWLQHRYLIAQHSAPDSLYLWRAANCTLDGLNPWQDLSCAPVRAADAAWSVRLVDPLYYPLPAVLVWMPFARLPFLVASTVFNTLGAFLFVLAVTRMALHRAWMCGSVPFMIAMRFGQWSPLLIGVAASPWLSGLLVTKPNLGLPLFAARPTWRAGIACAALLVLPTIAAPWWVGSWLHNVRSDLGRTAPHPVPLTMFSGAGALLLVLALLRWRRPEARLLALMACVPQLPYWSDQLPLMLVGQTRREVQGMMLVTLLGFVAWIIMSRDTGDFVDTIRPYAIVCTYFPALALVLRRPNEGTMVGSTSAN